MNSDESYLIMRIFYKEKTFEFQSKSILTLLELKEKALQAFSLLEIDKNLIQFFCLKNNEKQNISEDDDIIKYSSFDENDNLKIDLNLSILDKNDNKDMSLSSETKNKISGNKEIKDLNINANNIEYYNILNRHKSFRIFNRQFTNNESKEYEKKIKKLENKIKKIEEEQKVKYSNLEQMITNLNNTVFKEINIIKDKIKEIEENNINKKLKEIKEKMKEEIMEQIYDILNKNKISNEINKTDFKDQTKKEIIMNEDYNISKKINIISSPKENSNIDNKFNCYIINNITYNNDINNNKDSSINNLNKINNPKDLMPEGIIHNNYNNEKIEESKKITPNNESIKNIENKKDDNKKFSKKVKNEIKSEKNSLNQNNQIKKDNLNFTDSKIQNNNEHLNKEINLDSNQNIFSNNTEEKKELINTQNNNSNNEEDNKTSNSNEYNEKQQNNKEELKKELLIKFRNEYPELKNKSDEDIDKILKKNNYDYNVAQIDFMLNKK